MIKSKEVSEYLNKLPEQEKGALETIRKQVLRLVTGAEEGLSGGVPFFYYKGRRVVGFRSSKTHLSFFIMDGNVLERFRSEISAYDNSSTVIKFKPEYPLDENIIEKLVLARIEEIEKVPFKK